MKTTRVLAGLVTLGAVVALVVNGQYVVGGSLNLLACRLLFGREDD